MAQPLVVKKDDDLDEEGGYAARLSAPLALPPRRVRARAQICARRALDLARSARDRRRARGH
jgi:hypothetical protein